jgi:hypothetical protein
MGASNLIPALDVEVELLKAFRRFLRTQQLIGVAPPIMVLVSLLGVRDCSLDTRHHSRAAMWATYPFERDHLIIPGAIVDSFDADRGSVFKPIFEVLWNAGGFPRCLDYKEEGALNIDPSRFQGEFVM